MLSPHSKILAQVSGMGLGVGGRPDSVASNMSRSAYTFFSSVSAFPYRPIRPSPSISRTIHERIAVSTASVMTKSGVFKDERDTERRRMRHRNGKLLKEGLGLTTGLGWSDRCVFERNPVSSSSRLSVLTN